MKSDNCLYRSEIAALIQFYECRGWDWFPVVAFLCYKYRV